MMRRRTRAWMGVAAAGLSLLLAAACGSSSNNNAKDAGAATPCKNSLDCVHAPGGLGICNTAAGVCVQCVAATDCPADNDCVDNACVPYTPCATSLDCPTGQVCDASSRRCVACNGNNDCTGGKHCIGNVCRAPCSSDKDCTPLGLLCNTSLGVCVQCTSAADCGAGETCNAGNCVAGGVGGAGGSGAGGTSGNGGGGSTGVGGTGGSGGTGGAGTAGTGGAGGDAGTTTCSPPSGSTATATSQSNASFGPENAIDGDVATNWNSGKYTGQIDVHFPAAIWITGLNLCADAVPNSNATYTIYGLPSGGTVWNQIGQASVFVQSSQWLPTIDVTPGNYAGIRISANVAKSWVSILEIQLVGTCP